MNKINRGYLIAFEGIDGSGKTTVIERVATVLRQHNNKILTTRQPGGSAIGQEIRDMVRHKAQEMGHKTQFLLFSADKAEHIEKVVAPALKEQYIVLCDRMIGSSIAYQGYGNGVDLDMINALNRWTLGDVVVDLTLYLKIDLQTAEKRRQQRHGESDSFDNASRSFFNRVIDGYESIYHNNPNAIHIDATQPFEKVVEDCVHAINWLLNNRESI